MSEWQPIETAPKDGKKILVCSGRGKIAVSRWIGSGFHAGSDGYGLCTWTTLGDCALTHWMPLPAPPTTTEEPS